jgi:hypothetical protein
VGDRRSPAAAPISSASRLLTGAEAALPPVEAVDTLEPEALPAFIATCAALQARAASRLLDCATQPRDDAYLSVDEVATQLRVDPAWVYRQAARWSFAVKLSSKVVRVERAGLRRWLSRHTRRHT